MKNIIVLFSAVIIAGCAYEGQRLREYFDSPRSFIRDPHFVDYKEKRDALESEYLQKGISYAEYVEQMDALDENYAREVQERDRKIGE